LRPEARLYGRFRALPDLFSGTGERGLDTGNKKIIMVTDPVSDMLTRIRNALLVGKTRVEFPYSQLKLEISRILKEAGYVAAVERRGRRTRKLIELSLTYQADGSSKISGLKRISKPSRRVYKKAADFGKVKQGLGVAIVSTSKGLMTGLEARRASLGGEVICEVW